MLEPPATASSSSTPLEVLPSPAVHAVALKLPPFWPNDPVVWFAPVEAQFLMCNITSQSTQFAYVILSLPPEIAQEICDLLLSPPSDHPYDTLKSEIIHCTSALEQKRLHLLLISEDLGDRKPHPQGRSPMPPLHTARHSASTSRSNCPHCWYHMRFGSNAEKSIPLCCSDSAAST